MLDRGAPGDIPPCGRQRPFGIAGDRYRLPLTPRSTDDADHRLPARIEVDVLDQGPTLFLGRARAGHLAKRLGFQRP
jgi:hypothetical protein